MTAAALTAFLAPLLPALLKGGEEVVVGVAGRVGEAALEHGRRLWARLRPGVEASPAAQEAATEVAAAPEDERWRVALELQLRKVLADDALRAEVEALFAEAQAAGAVAALGERSVAVGRDVTGSTIVTGDDVRVGGT